jgi:hypothetical protein
MDDFSPVDVADVQAAVLNWMIAHQVKFNFGIIAGNDPTDPWSTYWPANCPGDDYCDDPSVMAVQAAYDNGHVLGTSHSAVLEIGNHAFNHEGWSSQWAGYQPKDTWHQFQIDDLNSLKHCSRQSIPMPRSVILLHRQTWQMLRLWM